MSIFSSYYLLIFTFLTLTLNLNPSFSHHYNSLNKTPNFDPDTALFGDAELINGSVQLNRPIISSSYGFIILKKKPVKFIQSNPTSFSTDFTFSISPQNGQGHGLSLEIKPASKASEKSFGITRYLGIRFNGNNVRIEVDERLGKSSSFDLFLNSAEKFHSWVDYEASSKQIEIRVGKFGSPRPYNPVLMYPIDLSKMWNEEEVFAGLSSSRNDHSVQSISVYSWNFRVRAVPKWLHSQPINPQDLTNQHVEQKTEKKKRFCHLGVLTFGCGALAAMVLLSLWAIFVDRNAVIPAEDSMRPMDFRYRKIDVVVENGFEDAKK